MQQKILLLATFLKVDYLDNFLNKIKKRFNIKKENIFFFKLENDNLLLTYKLHLDFDNKIDIKKELPNTIQIHKKNDTIFTINALNKLIELESGLGGNVNYKEYKIDWDKYKNKIILLKGDNLEINNIERIFLSEG
jgi:hypothetical protein